ERLEFLGDAVLGFIVAGWLHQEYPKAAEGELTRMRSALVRRQTLAEVARSLELGDFLYLSKGEEQSGGRKRAVTLANGLEALVGALFLDQGAEATKTVVQQLLSSYLARLSTEGRDPKSRLQELLQARRHTRPAYTLLATSGASHERTFTVEVSVAGQPLARGTGPSKRAAEMEAATQALGVLTTHDEGPSEPVPGANEPPLSKE
ncbi:MAG: ribonuclease III, partial [Chloroflexi bacterium]|nr:ribonuclease III [Chloroflexota bacterium]